MKIAAHPLVVAAALGLLGPKALEGLVEEDGPCVGCASDNAVSPPPGGAAGDPPGAARDEVGQLEQTLFTVEAPSLEEVARVEDAWRRLR